MSLIHTRIAPPVEAVPRLTRPRLDALLARARTSRLTLVRAPSGYGKTVLLTQWAEKLQTEDHAVGWLSLRGRETSAAALYRYLDAMLDVMGMPSSPATAGEVGELAGALLGRLESAGRDVFVVLDEADRLAGEAAWLVATLIGDAPAGVRFLLAARGRPPLSMARLRAGGQVTEVSAVDLAFTLPEAVALAATRGETASADQLAAWLDLTEGWAAGLVLAPVAGASGCDREIYDYFDEETASFDPDLRLFLTRTSVLERVEPALCEAVHPAAEGRRTLMRLEGAGAFLVPLDTERGAWRHHRLYGQYLRRRFQDEDPQGFQSAHAAAGEWFVQAGHPAEALAHLLQAGALETLAETLETYCETLTYTGDIVLVARYAEALPEVLLGNYPRVLLTVAWLHIRGLDFACAVRLLQHARQRIEALEAGGALTDRARDELRLLLSHRQTMLAAAHDESSRVEADCQALLPAVSDTKPYLACTLYGQLLSARAEQFHFDGLGRLEVEARAAFSRLNHDFASVSTQAAIGPALFAVGRTDAARQALEAGFERAVRHAGLNSSLAALPALHLAELAYEANELVRAQALVDGHLPVARQFGFVDQLIAGHVVRARLRHAAGDEVGALASLEESYQAAAECGVERLRLNVVAEQVRTLARLGRAPAARQLAESESLLEGDAMPHANSTSRDELRALVRARLDLAEDGGDGALARVRAWKLFCSRRGAVRALVRWNLILCQLHAKGDDAQSSRRSLRDAVLAGAPGGYVRSFLDEGPIVHELLAESYKQGAALDDPAERFVQKLLAAVAGHDGAELGGEAAAGLYGRLMAREVEILSLVASGLRNREIGERLGLTEGTVKWYMQQIYDKLGVRRRPQAVIRARHFGLLGG